MVTLADCLALLDAAYDPSWAESWDAVGLVLGDRADPVRSVLVAVDPAPEVAAEALAGGHQLLVTHHPLFLRGVHGISGDTPGGRTATALVRGGVALVAAHTNADVARPGVNDALAEALGLQGPLAVLSPGQASVERLDALDVYVPTPDRDRLLDAVTAAGAGTVGDYTRCAWWTGGTGTFTPQPGARPAIGELGRRELVAEDRLELVLPRGRRAAVVAALRAAHPYEEPAFRVTELAVPAPRGLGRVGDLPAAMPLASFGRHVAAALPATGAGVRVAGDPDRPVRRVAVCGGAGDDQAAAALRAGADVLVTADCRHHRTRDALEAGLAVVDATHWATEWPWTRQVAALLTAALPELAVTVSTLVTDPWSAACPAPGTAPGEGT
jgi:dinuclear metal center YbgI/SA1388 family protein